MRYLIRSFCFVAIGWLMTGTLAADPVLTVVASSAPNFFNMPSFQGYNANALNSLENGLGDLGNRLTDPTGYEQITDGSFVAATELIVSNFNSWRGVADPGSPFENELGNRLHFGLHILGDGATQFRLEDLLFEISSDDGNSFGFAGDFVGLDYSEFRVGIDWGADRMRGTGDDVRITSGTATQFVDEIVYVGVGNGIDASGQPGPTDQERIAQAIASRSIFYPIRLTGAYTLNDASGNLLGEGSTTVFVIPEPGSGLVLLSLSAVLVNRRRR